MGTTLEHLAPFDALALVLVAGFILAGAAALIWDLVSWLRHERRAWTVGDGESLSDRLDRLEGLGWKAAREEARRRTDGTARINPLAHRAVSVPTVSDGVGTRRHERE